MKRFGIDNWIAVLVIAVIVSIAAVGDCQAGPLKAAGRGLKAVGKVVVKAAKFVAPPYR